MDKPKGRPQGAPYQNMIKTDSLFNLMDQVFEIEQKLEVIKEPNSIKKRNISRIKDIFKNIFKNIHATPSEPNCGLSYHNPIIGEKYDETRTDLEASIAGESTKDLVIKEVNKPIIRFRAPGIDRIVRKGVVVVGSKTNKKEIGE